MAGVSICLETSDIFHLHPDLGLFLKPIYKIEILVMFPNLKISGTTISNWEIMEKLKLIVNPLKFISLKIVKMIKTSSINPFILEKFNLNCNTDYSNNEFLYLEAEVETYNIAINIVDILNGKRIAGKCTKGNHYSIIKLSGIDLPLKIRSSFAGLLNLKNFENFNNNEQLVSKSYLLKPYINTSPLTYVYKDDLYWLREHWLSYFHWNNITNQHGLQKKFNETKSGYRPDTIFIKGLPTKWFLAKYKDRDYLKVLEGIVAKVFSVFGVIKNIDIPTPEDPFCNTLYTTNLVPSNLCSNCNLKSKLSSPFLPLTFDVYIQFENYDSFESSLKALVSNKLLYLSSPPVPTMRKDGKLKLNLKNQEFYTALIQCDFDRNKRMTDFAISRRKSEKEQLEKEILKSANASCSGPCKNNNFQKMELDEIPLPNNTMTKNLTDAIHRNRHQQQTQSHNTIAFKLKSLPAKSYTFDSLENRISSSSIINSTNSAQATSILDQQSSTQTPWATKNATVTEREVKPSENTVNQLEDKKKKRLRKNKNSKDITEKDMKRFEEALAERKLLLAQRKRDSIRLLQYLFNTIHNEVIEKNSKEKAQSALEEAKRAEKIKKKRERKAKHADFLISEELKLRQNLIKKYSRKAYNEIRNLIKNTDP